MLVGEVLSRLRQLQNPAAVQALQKQGMTPRAALGVSEQDLRKLAAELARFADAVKEVPGRG